MTSMNPYIKLNHDIQGLVINRSMHCNSWQHAIMCQNWARNPVHGSIGPLLAQFWYVYDIWLVLFQCLTQWGRDKMATILQTTFLKHFLEGKYLNFDNFSQNFVPKGQTNNIPALVQIMAWCRPGDMPLPEPMMVNLLTHICITIYAYASLGFKELLLISRFFST